jgi:F0F1-type ATP synthase membrane subunit c/vacuolar-type H+-ATPase subunit K
MPEMRNRVFAKSLYSRDRHTSGTRLLRTGAGLALGAWGISHSPMVGNALARGVRAASEHQSQAAIDAMQVARSAYGAMARGTARGERQVRQIQAVNRSVDKVPVAIRPAVATSAGMLLLGGAFPVRRTSYHPVNIRIRTGVNR